MTSSSAGPVLPDPRAPLAAGEHRALALRFDDHALAAPDRLAVADWARTWTYRDLRDRANQLAHWLIAKGIGPDQIVAIRAERSALTVWAMLGVLKSGAAFMLLDSDYPAERIVAHVKVGRPVAWIDAAPSRVAPELGSAENVAAPRIALATADEELRHLPTSSPVVDFPPDRHAYVVFTSGTTGTPKGATATSAALAHFVEWQAARFALRPEDRFSALSGLAHLPFTRDVLTPLSVGASIHVPPQELRLEPDRLSAWLATSRITVSHFTPSLAEVLTLAPAGTVKDLRWVFFAGEALRSDVVERFRKVAPATGLVNFYGASETGQSVSYLVVDPTAQGILPIGRGIDRVQLLLLKDDDALAAVGEEGEICVRTPYLATAYLNGEVGGFGVNPFTRDPHDRVYRTGDRGLYRSDGSVQVLGRRDDQVKVRGFRVEPREVEEAIERHPGVTRAVVLLREETRSLVAYVVGPFEAAALLDSLRRRLPDYMVPGVIVPMERMPLTPNGKLDKKALPAPAPLSLAGRHDAPANEIEKAVADIWADVLGCDTVGRNDNFFDLGGHSLNATQVAARLRDFFVVDVTVRAIFDKPTVVELATWVTHLVVKAAPRDA
jgi:amino acid adenylation domain-containing protein